MYLEDFTLTVAELKDYRRREELARVCSGKQRIGDRDPMDRPWDYDYGWNYVSYGGYSAPDPIELAPQGLILELGKRFPSLLSDDSEIRLKAHAELDEIIPIFTLPSLQEHWDRQRKDLQLVPIPEAITVQLELRPNMVINLSLPADFNREDCNKLINFIVSQVIE